MQHELIVLPEQIVEVDCSSLMGGVSEGEPGGTGGEPAHGGARIRVSGWAVMGGIDIQRRYPGESARDARKRSKKARRALNP